MSRLSNEILQLKNLFIHYSCNEPYLTNKQYIKFLSDAQLLDATLTAKYSNILFYSFTKAKNNLTFQSFYDLVIKIAEIKFPDEFMHNHVSTIKMFFSTYIKPLLEILTNPATTGNNFNYQLILSKLVSKQNTEILDKNYLFFSTLYQKYFCFEKLNISGSQKVRLSNKALIKLFSDFSIIPDYISVTTLNDIYDIIFQNYDYVLELFDKIIHNKEVNQNLGTCFTLFHFITSFYLVAINNIICTNIDEVNPTNFNDVFITGNDSLAFDKILMLMYKNESLKNILPEDAIQKEISMRTQNDKNGYTYSFKADFKEQLIQQPPTQYFRTKLVKENEELMTIQKMCPIVLSKYYHLLISVYKFYSELYYETNFSVFMTQNGLNKFIRDIGLVEGNNGVYETLERSDKYIYSKIKANLLSFANINFIFSKYSSVKNKKINFENFVTIIHVLANKIYNPRFNSLAYDNKCFNLELIASEEFPVKYVFFFIENYISPIYSDIRNFVEEESFSYENLNVIFSSDELSAFINDITANLMQILSVYSDNKSEISYNGYFKFLCDFEIFPDLVTRTKMIKVFINFIDNFDKEKIVKGDNRVSLELKRCAYAVIFIVIGGPTQVTVNNSEDLVCKIVYFMQRMLQTKGFEKITIKCGSNKIQKDFNKAFLSYKNKIKPAPKKQENKKLYELI